MTEKINILLFDEEETTQILIENYLKELTFSYDFKKFNEINFSALSNNEQKIIIVNITKSNLSILQEIKKYSADKNNLFIAISYEKTADLNVTAIRAGAKEFLVKPLIKNDFLNTIQKLNNIFKLNRNSEEKCTTSLIMSTEKGVGKTFFALNTAKEVADVSREKVLLIDFNNDLNDLGSKLNMDFVYNTPYIMKEIIKGNYSVLKRINRYQNSSLYVMANGVFCNSMNYSNENLEIFFSKIKKHFRYIFLDIQPEMETNRSIIKHSDSIYAILEPNLEMASRLYNTVRIHYKGKRVRYILNKFNENKDAELVAKLEDIINKQIFLRIPLNYMATNASLSHGKTLKEITPKLDVVEKYTKLGGFIATRE